MNDRPISKFQRAQLRLEAWKNLDGWATTPKDGERQVWNWETRMRYASELAAWAEEEE